MKKRRIVVTGMGAVTPFGNNVDKFYQFLLQGKSAVSKITHFSCDEFSTQFAAYIENFDSEDYIEKKQARRIDPFIAYALVAGKKALEYGSVNSDQLNKKRCGVIIGSGMGGMEVFSEGVKTLEEKGPRRVTPFFIPYIITNMAGGLLAKEIGFMGPNYSISTACATGNNAIIAAANHIRIGDAELMICGGVEAAINPIGLAGFCSCKALSVRNDSPQLASRPWDRDRDGFVMGEGAGVLVLEELEHAKKRGATIYAEYFGGGLSCDAHHMTEPKPDGAGVVQCVKNALNEAEINPEDISYINAHATSTPAGDMVEIQAMKQIFSQPEKIIINSTKSMIGHGLGAAAGIEAVVTAQAIHTGNVHPTINLDHPEPGLSFHAPVKSETFPVSFALSNSFGFGGHNASIILGKYSS